MFRERQLGRGVSKKKNLIASNPLKLNAPVIGNAFTGRGTVNSKVRKTAIPYPLSTPYGAVLSPAAKRERPTSPLGN